MSKNIPYKNDQSTFNTLDRELSIRINHPNKELSINDDICDCIMDMSVQSNRIESSDNKTNKTNKNNMDNKNKNNKNMNKFTKKNINLLTSKNKSFQTPITNITSGRNKISIDGQNTVEKKLKYIETDKSNFVEFFSMGNKLGQNYNTDQENDLRFSESTRRKTLPKSTLSVYKKLSRDTKLDDIIESPTKNKVSNDINSKLSERIMSISSNNIDDRLRYQSNLKTDSVTNNSQNIVSNIDDLNRNRTGIVSNYSKIIPNMDVINRTGESTFSKTKNRIKDNSQNIVSNIDDLNRNRTGESTFSKTKNRTKDNSQNIVSNIDDLNRNRTGESINSKTSNNLNYTGRTKNNTLNLVSNINNLNRDTNNANDIINIVSNDSKLRPNTVLANGKIQSINQNEIIDIAAKVSKVSPDYWDNTKRRNLDTSVYTNNPSKIQGRGFGDVNSYGLYLNGVGVSTRQDNPDEKPQNVEDDRIYLTNHNYHYDKHHVTEVLPCGHDTRYLNKKMI